MKRVIMPILVVTLAAACGRDDSNVDKGVPSDVVEAVRDQHPRTRAEDITSSHETAKSQSPDASDEDVTRSLIEALDYNAQVEERNACLDMA